MHLLNVHFCILKIYLKIIDVNLKFNFKGKIKKFPILLKFGTNTQNILKNKCLYSNIRKTK